MSRKTRRGRELDASAFELVAPERLQPGQEQIEALRRDCQRRNAADSYHQLFSSEPRRGSTGHAQD
jgi:hypothetical protein